MRLLQPAEPLFDAFQRAVSLFQLIDLSILCDYVERQLLDLRKEPGLVVAQVDAFLLHLGSRRYVRKMVIGLDIFLQCGQGR